MGGDGYGADLSFNFYVPTRLVFGAGTARDVGIEAKRLGIERACVVTDRFLREKTDVVAKLEKALGARHAFTYDGVVPDTGVEIIDRGAAEARGHGCDGVISAGGGSAIDTAKGMAILLTEGGSIRDHQGSQRLARRLVPHLAVPTTAGTGSEVSVYIVVKDEAAKEKMHFVEDRVIPDTAVLDPELTLGLPPGLTAATGMDALTHAIEAYTAVGRSPVSDGLALQAAKMIFWYLPLAVKQPGDRVARGQMLLASTIAGAAMSNAGVGLAHAMAHVLGARHGLHHGTANAICLPHVIRFNNDELAERYAELALAAGLDARGKDAAAAGRALADAVEQLVGDLGLPARLRAAKVPEGDLEACAEGALSDGAIVFNGKPVTERDVVLGVYKEAY